MADNTDQNVIPSEPTKSKIPVFVFFEDIRSVFKRDELGMEILQIALPAALALAADPIASLIDTAFIGHLGPVEIAAVGVAIAIFNQASKVTIFPLVSITTSFVAEEDAVKRMSDRQNQNAADHDLEKGNEITKLAVQQEQLDANDDAQEKKEPKMTCKSLDVPTTTTTTTNNNNNNSNTTTTTTNSNNSNATTTSNLEKGETENKRRHIPSASTALALGSVLGLLQTILLVLFAKPFLSFMGVKSGSPMMAPAHKYLTIRSLGAPAVLLSLAMQGVFRGFKDTKTPLYATVAGDLANIILDPIFIFVFRWGVSGAAIAHVLSQYLISLILFVQIIKQVILLPPSIKDLQFSKFLKNGFLLLARVVAVTICVTLSASMAARLGPTQMAAFQICLQVWMTSSLLADGLAVAGQAILACSFAEKDYQKASSAAARVLQMGFVLGLGLAVFVGLGLQFGSGIFTKDKMVIHTIAIGIPFVAATQPINSLAFVFDGVNFGASDFAFSAYSMVLVSMVSIGSLFALSKSNGFVGIWFALTIYMGLRAFAGFWRMGTGTGPWYFLRGRRSSPSNIISS